MINHNENFPNLDGIENGGLSGLSTQCLMVDYDPLTEKSSVSLLSKLTGHQLENCVYRKKTDEGLLLHYHSHVDN